MQLRKAPSLTTTREYLGWARDRFGGSVAIRSALWQLTRFDQAVRVPSRYGPVWLRPGTADLAVYDEVIRADVYSIPVSPLPKVIVDAGAHIGLSARVFAQLYPDAQIVCLEPEPGNAALARRNTAECSRVTVLQAGLWSHQTHVQIQNPFAATWSYRVRAADAGVTAYGVADLMRMFHWSRIDVLKIDIEGAEVEALQHAPDWIGQVQTLIVELHDRFRSGCSKALERAVDGAGFTSVQHRGDVVIYSRA